MTKAWVGWGVAVAAGLGLVACGKPEPEARRFVVRGVVQEIRDGGKVLVIDHEEIPGYMQAMIMPFRVKDESQAASLAPGAEIEFTYVVQDVSSWMEKIVRTGKQREVKRPASPEPASQPQTLGIGERLPDYGFQDENAKEVKLSDFRGGPVALTFIFTRCPVPEYCPATMRKFAAVQAALSQDPEAPAKWRLLAISFDSANDKPAVLKSFGAAFGQDPARWSLLASPPCCMQELAKDVGLRYGEVKGSYEHNLRTVVLDAEGKIARIFLDETWAPDALIAAMKAAGIRNVAGP